MANFASRYSGDNGGDTPASDLPSYDDYSAAAKRLQSGQSAEGTPAYVQDAETFRKGDATYGDRLDQELMQQDAQPTADDPNSWGNIAARTAINVGSALNPGIAAGNLAAGAANTISGLATKYLGAQPAQPILNSPNYSPELQAKIAAVNARNASARPFTSPTAAIQSAAGVPDMGPNASMSQQIAEGAIPILAASAPAAINAAANAAPGLLPIAGAAASSLLKNAVIAPGAAAAGGYIGQQYGGDPGRFVGSLLGGMVPSTVAAPLAQNIAERYYAGRYADDNAPQIAQAAQNLGVTPRFGQLATEQGKRLEQRLATYYPGLAEAERSQFQNLGDQAVQDRLALPQPTAQSMPMVANVASARAAQRAAAGQYQPGTAGIDAVENAIAPYNGASVDVTPTMHLMQSLAAAPGGQQAPTMQPAGVGGGASRQGINAQLQNLQAISTNVGGRMVAPLSAVRQWRSEVATTRNGVPGVTGTPLAQVYPSITNDMRNGAVAAGMHPSTFDQAMQIERGEFGARDLGDAINRTLDEPKATYARSFGRYMQDLRSNPTDYQTQTGQPVNPNAPQAAPSTGPGDIAQRLENIASLARASYVPQKQGGLREALSNIYAQLGLPGAAGIGTAVFHTLPAGAAVAAPIPVANYIRSRVIQSPGVINAMAGRGYTPPARVPTTADLLAAMQAARMGQTRGSMYGFGQ